MGLGWVYIRFQMGLYQISGLICVVKMGLGWVYIRCQMVLYQIVGLSGLIAIMVLLIVRIEGIEGTAKPLVGLLTLLSQIGMCGVGSFRQWCRDTRIRPATQATRSGGKGGCLGAYSHMHARAHAPA